MTKKQPKEILIGCEPHDTMPKRPRGRPLSYKQQIWDEVVQPHFRELVTRCFQDAMEGSEEMQKIFLAKGLPREIRTGQLTITDDAATTLHNIMLYANDGHCSIDEAVKLSTIVRERANVGEYKKLSEQLESFEAWMKDQAEGVKSTNLIEGRVEHGGKEKALDCGSDEE